MAILSVLKVGVGWSAGLGTGLVVARRRDGSWSPPSSVLSISAGAWGWDGERGEGVIVEVGAEGVAGKEKLWGKLWGKVEPVCKTGLVSGWLGLSWRDLNGGDRPTLP